MLHRFGVQKFYRMIYWGLLQNIKPGVQDGTAGYFKNKLGTVKKKMKRKS